MCHRRFPPPDITLDAIESAADILSGEQAPPATNGAGRTAGAATAPTRDNEPHPARSESTGAFTVTDAGITWSCPKCETKNPLAAQACSVCGTPFGDVVLPPVERPERDPNMAALLSLFLPGAGHAYIGSMGQAIARAVLSIWVVGVVVISLFAGGKSNSGLVTLVFAFVATALWLVAAHDAYREAKGDARSVILKGKLFLYVVLSLLMLLFMLLMSASLQATS
jgi:hypothetical protein